MTLDQNGRFPERSIFLVLELPELLLNEKVTTINGRRRERLLELANEVTEVTKDSVETMKFINEELNNRREIELASNKRLLALVEKERETREKDTVERAKEQEKSRELETKMRRQKEEERRQQQSREAPHLSHEL